MTRAATELEFERAADLRNELVAVEAELRRRGEGRY
jgi:excinuclease UvrABC helicase subunit UvrB